MKQAVMGLILATGLSSCAALHNDQPPAEPETVIVEVDTDDGIIIADPAMSAQADTGDCMTVSAQGLCGATFGMTRAQLEAAFPASLKVSFADPDTPNCYYMQVAEEDRGYYFMILDDQFQRLDIYTPNLQTDRGAKIGSPLEVVEGLYSNATRQPNFYVSVFNDLVIDFDPEHRVIFDMDGADTVKLIRIGLTEPVNRVEGCL